MWQHFKVAESVLPMYHSLGSNEEYLPRNEGIRSKEEGIKSTNQRSPQGSEAQGTCQRMEEMPLSEPCAETEGGPDWAGSQRAWGHCQDKKNYRM